MTIKNVETYDIIITTLSGERTKKVIEIISDRPKTMSEITQRIQEDVDILNVSYILSTLDTQGLIDRGDYKLGQQDEEPFAAPTFSLNKEKLNEYVGRLKELTGFYENLL